jgi:hypothetical protein
MILNTTPRRIAAGLSVLMVIALGPGTRGFGQLTPLQEERLQILSDPEALKSQVEKDRTKAPFEFIRSVVAPFDVLPFVKPNQWATMTLEVKANHGDYEGSLVSFPVPLVGMPQEMVYGREARLLKGQSTKLSLQLLLPRLPKEKELNFRLMQAGAIRPDELWSASLRFLPPHQMLVVVLARDSANEYAAWNRLPCFLPATIDREDTPALDLQRYYRLVLPLEPERPFLSPHPLAWLTISHFVWDGVPPDAMPVSQQQAMLDWLHWGGQLVLVGGAGPTFSYFRDSFLAPYLPAEPVAESRLLGESDLAPLSQTYPPPLVALSPGAPLPPGTTAAESFRQGRLPYQSPVAIRPAPNRPLYVAGLRPKPGTAVIPLGQSSPHVLAVEGRVGRGRITMLAINPNDPALVAWPGLDTLVRRVILRRPEEPVTRPAGFDGYNYFPATRSFLEGPELSWLRISSRDLGAEAEQIRARSGEAGRESSSGEPGPDRLKMQIAPRMDFSSDLEQQVARFLGVAEWRDSAPLPRLCRDLLEQASGISVPSAQFVLKVILAYLIAVVPLNWLVCRYLLDRREWAWVMVPLLALGFAIGVERVAAYDLGYDSAGDEIDLLELYADYPRAHLSRFGSIYTTGRGRYRISFPGDPTALALPLDTGRSIGGEEISTSSWLSYPVPTLEDFTVQPRSLSLFRAEQVVPLRGSISLAELEGTRLLVNQSELTLHNATLIEPIGDQRRERSLGTIGPGETVELDRPESAQPISLQDYDGPDPRPILELLKTTWGERPEDAGEVRLVAWLPRPLDGPVVEPPLDRRRGMTCVVVHLRFDNPPSPSGPRYDLLAATGELPSPPFPNVLPSVAETMEARPPQPVRPRERRSDGGFVGSGDPRLARDPSP